MAMGWGRAEGWDLRPRPTWFCLAPSLPLGASPHPVKVYFLLICPTISTIFFNEIYFINKNILEITTKFILSNQINFFKKIE